jgi:hypothetical protein
MITAKNVFELAQSAEASYANLWKDNQVITDKDKVKAALINLDEDTGEYDFSPMQAEIFVNTRSVIRHILRAGQGVLDIASSANESRIRKAA